MHTRFAYWTLSFCLALGCAMPMHTSATPRTDAIQDQLRTRLAAGGLPEQIQVQGATLHARTTLLAFYERRVYKPAWVSDAGGLLPQARALQTVLEQAHTHGLRATTYHADLIAARVASLPQPSTSAPAQWADLDLLLTDAFLMYASHMVAGQVNPETFESLWVANRREVDVLATLEDALATGAVAEALADLEPKRAGYAQLRQALGRYRTVQQAGGWATVASGPTFRLGDTGSRVRQLHERLRHTGDGTGAAHDSFSVALENSVKQFQRRHGLEADGVVGPMTLAALNVPVETRIQQLEWNLERWRWFPADLGERYLLVNVAGFYVQAVEGDHVVLEMDVIVGRPYRRTPVFSDRMTYLVLSPYWHVPHSLAVQDKLPAIKKDVGYLSRGGYTVLQGWGSDERVIDPQTIDWATLSRQNFPYRLRQDPVPNNALGMVKFMFPNRFNVSLHDSPQRELFSRAERSFSSGCIRLGRPLDLVAYLLRDQPAWTPAAIERAARQKNEQTVQLRQAIPIHLQYWTAWSVGDEMHFRRDIYERDQRLAVALAPFLESN